jgi:DNA-binding response OmpR family regulator
LYAGGAVPLLLLQHDAFEAVQLAAVLERAGFGVTVAPEDVQVGRVDAAAFDVIIVGVGGSLAQRIECVRRTRASGYLGAMVALSAEASEIDALLEAGADDFVAAPVVASELVARVHMALKRVVTGARLQWGVLELDRVHRSVQVRGRLIALTTREYELLARLFEAGGEVVSRADLLTSVWQRDEDPSSNLVEVHLSRLRDKLGADAAIIETVRRAGYRLRRPIAEEDGPS